MEYGTARQGEAWQERGGAWNMARQGVAGQGPARARHGTRQGLAVLGLSRRGLSKAWNTAGQCSAWPGMARHGKEHGRAHPQEQQTNTTPWTTNHYTPTH